MDRKRFPAIRSSISSSMPTSEDEAFPLISMLNIEKLISIYLER